MSPGLTKKLILATLLFLFMIFPIYRFILKLSSRKYTIEEYELEKKKLKKKAIIYSIFITIPFSLVYSLHIF